MNIYDSIFSPNAILNEQVARQVFEIIPEQAPLLVIMDDQGNCWPSDSERFELLNLSAEWSNNFRAKINDGAEPLISYNGNHCFVGYQLDSGRCKYGYIMMVIENAGPESLLAKMDMIEIILGQFGLIGKLIDKCNLLNQTQAKLFSPIYSN